ncbi:predicted protein [Naegleria gruberi]|uniref:Predicted protein n=1 Tax=Naegleria gruberi TaxID=5762 RepID=D2V7P2_NAEGR|nr:uncharacterized protein NAEGRDRAFT_47338 [Naegleria gruberi]EFC47036.1 predicted protein [Naegleria gruberi]|eukprot:XP_002679780.1 predicted protein [Naegleria gruberi strain NEG-M]
MPPICVILRNGMETNLEEFRIESMRKSSKKKSIMISSIKKKVALLKLRSIQESNASGSDHETFYQIRNQRSPRRREISNNNLTTLHSAESFNSVEGSVASGDCCSGNSHSSIGNLSPVQLMPMSPRFLGQLSPTLSPRFSTGIPSPRLSVQSSALQVYQSHIRFIFLASGESGRKTLSKLIRYNLEPEVIEKQAFDLNQSYSTLYFFFSNTIILLEQFYQMLFELKFPNQCINELPPILANVEPQIIQEILKDLKEIEDIPMDREFSVDQVNKLSNNIPMASNCKVVLKLITKQVYNNLILFFERQDVKLLIRKYHDLLQTQQHGTIFDRIEILKSVSHETLCEILEKPSNSFTKEEEELILRLFFISRQKLTGCSQFTLQLGPHKLSFCLVAGQRAERKKYPRYMEQGFEYVIFCMNLSEYNRNLYENDTITRFRDTIYMAHEYCCQDCKKYGNMSVIPVFTHLDQLMRQIYYGNVPNSANVWIPMCEEIAKLHNSRRSNVMDFIFSSLIPVKEVLNKLKYFAFIVGYPKEEFEMKLEKERSEMQLFIEPPPVEIKKSLRINENVKLSYYDWRVISQFLQPRELIKLSETCKPLHQLTSEDYYWQPAVKSSFGIDTAITICGDGANFLQTEGFKQFIQYYQEWEPPLEETDSDNYISDWKCSYKWFYLFGWSCVKIQKLLYSIVLTKSVDGVVDKGEMVNNCKVALSLDLSDWKLAAQTIERSNLYNKFV